MADSNPTDGASPITPARLLGLTTDDWLDIARATSIFRGDPVPPTYQTGTPGAGATNTNQPDPIPPDRAQAMGLTSAQMLMAGAALVAVVLLLRK